MPVFSDLWKEEEAAKESNTGREGKFEVVEPEPKSQLKSENEKGSKISSMDVIVKPTKLVRMANLCVLLMELLKYTVKL